MDKKFLELASQLSLDSIEKGGGPFGAVVVKNGEIIASASNAVTLKNDPTAHAEVEAIRAACAKLNTFVLDDCDIYCSCEPCPMCLSAIYWARLKNIYFANTKHDAKSIGFDDSFIYEQIEISPELRAIPSHHFGCKIAKKAFEIWDSKKDKIKY